MTLVAAFVSPSFSVLVADRRRSNLVTGEQIDDILKIRRLNNNVAVGYSGCYYMTDDGLYVGNAEQIIQACEHYTRHPRSTVESIAQIYAHALQSFLKQGIPKDQLEITFHLIGRSVDGGFCLGRVSVFEDFKPIITKPIPGKLVWGLSIAEYNPADWLQSEIDKLPEVALEEVQKLAVKLVEHTVEQDGYVSGKYDMLTLEGP